MTLRDLHASILAYDEVLFGLPPGAVSTCDDHHDGAEPDEHDEHDAEFYDAEPTIPVPEVVIPSVSLTIPEVVNDQRRCFYEQCSGWVIGHHRITGRYGYWPVRCWSWTCPYHGPERARVNLVHVTEELEELTSVWVGVAHAEMRVRRRKKGSQLEELVSKRIHDRAEEKSGYLTVRRRSHEVFCFSEVPLTGRKPPTSGVVLSPQTALEVLASALAQPGVKRVSGPWRARLPEGSGLWTRDAVALTEDDAAEALAATNAEFGGKLLGAGLDGFQQVAKAGARIREHLEARRQIVTTTPAETPQLLQSPQSDMVREGA